MGTNGTLPCLFLNQLRLHDPVMPTGAPKSKRTGPPEGAPAPKAPKASKKQHAGRTAPYQTVGALGAGVGTIIRGLIPSDGVGSVSVDSYAAVEGTSFRVVAGTIWALPETQSNAAEAYPDGEWAAKLARFQGVRTSDAQMRIGRYAVTDDMDPRPALPENLSGALIGMTSGYGANVQNMRSTDGAEVELEVLTLGPKWAHLGLSIGDRITPNALAHLLNRHFQDDETNIGFLCLRIHHWVEGKRSGRVSADAPARPIDEDAHAYLFNDPGEHAAALYDLEETTGPLSAMKRYRLPVSGDRPFTPDDARKVFDEMIQGREVHPMMWPTLAHPSVSFGALKSLMQKIARFRPNKDVRFPGGDNAADYDVNARVVMARRDAAVPEHQGRRLPARPAHVGARRHGGVQAPGRHRRRGLVVPRLRRPLAARCVRSRAGDGDDAHAGLPHLARDGHQGRPPRHASGGVEAPPRVVAQVCASCPRARSRSSKAHMVRSAELLRILKSFEGDMQMFERCADLVNADGAHRT